MRRDFAVWVLLCVTVGIFSVIFLSLALISSDEGLIMPLDDTYIHFQYARQMATGHPFEYNTGDEPTSGATSLLYSPLLALGYALGFTDFALAYWAVALGALSFLLSSWLIYLSVRTAGGTPLLSALVMLTFTLNGAHLWSAFSGMETQLFVLSALLSLYTIQKSWHRAALGAGSLAALIRPEGALIALPLAALIMLQRWQRARRFAWGALGPVLAVCAQPVVNLIVTGTFAATGNQAKSEFYDVSSPFPTRIERVFDHLLRMWREFFEGRAKYGDSYLPGIVFALAVLMIAWGVYQSWKTREIHVAALVGTWMLLLSGAVATLETAFWHYKRYQIPIMALAVPLAGWALVLIAQRLKRVNLVALLASVVLLFSAYTTIEFSGLYRNNVYVAAHFQLQMAEWIRDELPAEARVGVFDVGFTRYRGGHYTYDVVGLTTPDIAGAMRQGSGAVYDTMAAHPQRPDYLALYPIASHPTTIYLMRTSFWGRELARFDAPDVHNTTSAGPIQVVVEANWSGTEPALYLYDTTALNALSGFAQVGMLNIGDLDAETQAHYTWHNADQIPGYLTTLEELPYRNCSGPSCAILDGVRGINREEQFDLPPIASGQDYLVVMRAYAQAAAHLTLGCDETIGDLVVPYIAGNWVELIFQVPGDTDRLCLKTHDTYYPARYWFLAGNLPDSVPTDTAALATWDGIELVDYMLDVTPEALTLNTTWRVTPENAPNLHGDGKVFVHLYADGNPNQAPSTQWDGYLRDTLPLNNLLPGIYTQEMVIPLAGLPASEHLIGLGFYDQGTGERYTVQSEHADDAHQRILLESVSLP